MKTGECVTWAGTYFIVGKVAGFGLASALAAETGSDLVAFGARVAAGETGNGCPRSVCDTSSPSSSALDTRDLLCMERGLHLCGHQIVPVLEVRARGICVRFPITLVFLAKAFVCNKWRRQE